MSVLHVRLRVGLESYALPVANVLEVAEPGVLSAVPGAAGAMLGVRNLHGRILPVFDLARVLEIAGDGSAARVVVAEHRDDLIGLAVDEVVDVSPFTGDADETEAALLSGAVLEDGELVGIIDVERLFETLERQAT
jgi:purine-binding chemotaxis protein CheW